MELFREVIKKNIKMIIFYVVIGIVATFLSLYCINYFQTIIDTFQAGKLTLKMITIYGVILVISTIINYIQNYPEQKLQNCLYLDFKLQSLKKMKEIDYQEYQKIGTGRLTQKVEDGATAAREVVFEFWLRLLREIIPTALFSLFFICNIEKNLLIFILVGYVVVLIVTNIILNKLYDLKEKILVNQEDLSNKLVRGFMEFVVFRTNKKYDTEIKKANEGIKEIVDSKTKITLIHESFFTIFALIVCALKITILIYAIKSTNLTVGAVVTLITLIGKAYEPIAIFNVEYIDYKLNKVALKKYINLLDLPNDENMKTGEKIKNISGDISVQNVTFAYSNRNIVENLNLTIKENSKIALVGKSGSGKSTIIKLIIGLIKPKSGKIKIGKKNLSKLNLNTYYDFVTYVSQETPIFDGTLRENLIFDKKIKDSKILSVLEIVGLLEFYSKLESGLDTRLGEKGVLMSGGERQKVALARLFFDNSKLVILDEATSALDNIAERKVMKNIIEKLQNRTIIIIAHRLNITKTVDNIYVLEEGKIVEQGNYEELINKNGYFKELYTINKKGKLN